eukprot:2176656-Rhodomonas_salina.1
MAGRDRQRTAAPLRDRNPRGSCDGVCMKVVLRSGQWKVTASADAQLPYRGTLVWREHDAPFVGGRYFTRECDNRPFQKCFQLQLPEPRKFFLGQSVDPPPGVQGNPGPPPPLSPLPSSLTLNRRNTEAGKGASTEQGRKRE